MHRLGDYVAAVGADTATAAGAAPTATAAAATDGMLATCCAPCWLAGTAADCSISHSNPCPDKLDVAGPVFPVLGTSCSRCTHCLILLTFWPFEVIFVCFTANLVVIGHSLDLRLLLVPAVCCLPVVCPRLLSVVCCLPALRLLFWHTTHHVWQFGRLPGLYLHLEYSCPLPLPLTLTLSCVSVAVAVIFWLVAHTCVTCDQLGVVLSTLQ